MNSKMITERLSTNKANYRQSINRAAELLKGGEIVAVPTETVYGLAASAFDDSAINKVFSAKGRPQDNPLIVHIANIETLYDIATDIPKDALKCAEKFWPGPLTMVLKKTGKTAESVSAGLDTVAVRMPNHKICLDIITESGLALAAPSANTSGSPSPTTPQHVMADMDGKISAVVFGDECSVGVESTVVSFCVNPPRLLRPGAVTVEQLREIIPDITVDKAVLAEPEKGAKIESPGMKYKHYAPKTEAFLVEAESKDFVKFVNSKENCVAVCFEEEAEGITVPKIVYGKAGRQETLAHEVFAVLRKVDDFSVNNVFIHAPDKTGVGLAVYNRLLRAAAFRVIEL